MAQSPPVGIGSAPKPDGPSETTVPNGRKRTEADADTEPTREDKERLDRAAGDVADDLADFA